MKNSEKCFYTLWCDRTGYSEREQCGGKNFKKKKNLHFI